METLNNNLNVNDSSGSGFNLSILLGIAAVALLVAGFALNLAGSISALDTMAMSVFAVAFGIGALMVNTRDSAGSESTS